jgi:hypothetical protein
MIKSNDVQSTHVQDHHSRALHDHHRTHPHSQHLLPDQHQLKPLTSTGYDQNPPNTV